MNFKNKVVVVTGGASGIGLACCRELAQRHAAVAVVDVDEKAGRRAAKELRQSGGRVEFFPFNVSKHAQVEGGIDILINNAGIQRCASATIYSEEDWDLVLGVNLKGTFLSSYHRSSDRSGGRSPGARGRNGIPGKGLASTEAVRHYLPRTKASRPLIAKRKLF